jgi:membrane-bound lytic murein transglycosylase D
VERLKHYYPLFMKNAVKHNLPLEIAALGIVESRLKTSALSHKGALGIWQLMPRTAEVLGLEVSSLSDERTNAAKSTDAAFRHIRNLYEYFRGDWSLTLASYNAGISYVARTAKKYGIQDFWDFYKIPEFKKETLHYVPRIYAVAHILRNPKKYGISSPLVF